MGLINEHVTVLVIAGCASHRWWIFKGGNEIGQITLKVVERYQVVLKIN